MLTAEMLKRGESQSPAMKVIDLALLNEGVHSFHGGGLVSIAHDDAVVDQTLSAFERVLVKFQAEQLL